MSDKKFWETVARESAARFAAREAELTVQLEAALEDGRRASAEYDWLQKRASSIPEISVIDRDGKPLKESVLGVDFSADGTSTVCVRVLDLPETVDRISELERQRDEAVAREDVATYTIDALGSKCLTLETRLKVLSAVLTNDFSYVADKDIAEAREAGLLSRDILLHPREAVMHLEEVARRTVRTS